MLVNFSDTITQTIKDFKKTTEKYCLKCEKKLDNCNAMKAAGICRLQRTIGKYLLLAGKSAESQFSGGPDVVYIQTDGETVSYLGMALSILCSMLCELTEPDRVGLFSMTSMN